MLSIQAIYEKFAPKTRCFGCIYKHVKKNTIHSFGGIDKKKNKFVLHNNKDGYVSYHETLDDFSMLGLPLYYGDFMMLLEIKAHSILKRCQGQPETDSEFIYLMQIGRTLTELWRNKDLPLEMSCDSEAELQALLSTIDNLQDSISFEQEKDAISKQVEDLITNAELDGE